MNAKKWIAACACLAGSAFAADAQLDIVVRDFSVEHSDFENFSEEFASTGDDNYCKGSCGDKIYAMGLHGYRDDWYGRADLHKSCGNHRSGAGAKIGVDGKPMTVNSHLPEYLQEVSTAEVLKYGECADGSRNYANGQNSPLESVKTASCSAPGPWSNEVYYTPGMVQPYLMFDPPTDGEYDMYDGVHIQKLADLCDNGHFDQWYEDVDGVNFRINRTLDLPSVGRNLYQVNYNYNNGGFAPLDSVKEGLYKGVPVCNSAAQIKGVNRTPINSSCIQWGPQSLTIYCPPYNYQYASSQTDASGENTAALCSQWLAYGGPKSETAAQAAYTASGALGYKHLRNYSYTMMGYVKFKYNTANQENGGEVFEFVVDDDMWVFVDGVLVEDRGGVHSPYPAPGAVNIKTLAENNHGCHVGEPLADFSNCMGASDETGWGNSSWHHLHFFYAERQDNGPSNLLIRSSIAELAPSKFGIPSITQAVATIENGQSVISIDVNARLDAMTLASLMAQAATNENVKVGDKVDPATTNYAVLVKRAILDDYMLPRDYVIYGLLLTEVSEIPANVGEAAYEFRGVLVDENGNVIGNVLSSDGIAFNYVASAGSENMVYEYWNTHAIDIVTISGKRVDFFPSDWPKTMLYVRAESSSSRVKSSSSNRAESSSSRSHHFFDDDDEDDDDHGGRTSIVGTPELSGGLSVALQGNTLQVSTVRAGLLKIQVFDMVGHVIESLNENVPAGNFAYTFGKVGKGVYIVRVQQGAMVRTVRK